MTTHPIPKPLSDKDRPMTDDAHSAPNPFLAEYIGIQPSYSRRPNRPHPADDEAWSARLAHVRRKAAAGLVVRAVAVAAAIAAAVALGAALP